MTAWSAPQRRPDHPCRQKERNQEQQAAFDRALQSMDLLYAHQETMVWRMTRLLDGYPNAKLYADRGWVCVAPIAA